MDLLPYVAIGVVTIFVVIRLSQLRARQKESWKNAARRLNLHFSEGGSLSKMSMRGTLRGKRIRVRHEIDRHARSNLHFANVSVSLQAPCWRRISLSRRIFDDEVATFFGGEDREMGDSSFDSDFRIQGELDDELRQHLNDPKVRSAIRAISRQYESFELENGAVKIRPYGMFTCESELTRVIERAVDTAEILDQIAGMGDAPPETEEEELFPSRHSRQTHGEEQPSAIW